MSLRERREVVSLYREAGAADGVLFSVVRVAGSSYRQPGARMLVLADGRTAGTLSGGCLEADLLRRAAWTVRLGAVVEQFSTRFDDTAEIPYGLGCGGDVDLLAEPMETLEAEALLHAMDATLGGEERVIATLLPGRGEPLQRVILDRRWDVLFATESIPTEAVVEVRALARSAAGSSVSTWMETPLGTLHTERLLPVQRLVIFGAGEDARPLARLAFEMGWVAVVVDTRAKRVAADRFPQAQCMVATAAGEVPVLPADAVVLMTHSYQHDRELLSELLQAPPRYLGLLGARHRSSLLLHEASVTAGVPLANAVACTHAPIGLELGGEGPEAVALAIVAELQHVLAGSEKARPVASRRLHMHEVERLLADGPAASRYENCVLSSEQNVAPAPEVAVL